MKSCKYFQGFFISALYNELDHIENEKFQKHLRICSRCSQDFKNKQKTLEFMSLREVDAPTEQFWEEFQNKIEDVLEEENYFSDSLQKKNFSNLISFSKIPRWNYQLAAAVLLLAVGFFVGKQYFSTDTHPIVQSQFQGSTTLIPTAIESNAYDYIEKSKLLLMGIVNMEVDVQQSTTFDFSLQREKAHSLIERADYLKGNLNLPHQRKLKSLISDLESILLQIANLEMEHDLSAIEVIKVGTEQKSLFLKINLHDLKRINIREEKEKGMLESKEKIKI